MEIKQKYEAIQSNKHILREQLENDVQRWLAKGEVIQTIDEKNTRHDQERVIKKGLFYTTHYAFITQKTGLSNALLKQINLAPASATEEQINILYQFFKARRLTYWVES